MLQENSLNQPAYSRILKMQFIIIQLFKYYNINCSILKLKYFRFTLVFMMNPLINMKRWQLVRVTEELFDLKPLYLNISADAASWGAREDNNGGTVYHFVYSRGIFYAPDSFSEKWGIGQFRYQSWYQSYGKLNEKTYYWYNESNEEWQLNKTNIIYYWFCLGC